MKITAKQYHEELMKDKDYLEFLNNLSKKKLTFGEYEEQLKKEPKYLRLQELLKEQRNETEREFIDNSKPLNDILKKMGLIEKSVNDLLSAEIAHPELIPILKEHSKREEYVERVKSVIIDALAKIGQLDKNYRESLLEYSINEYKKSPDGEIKNTFANAIWRLHSKKDTEKILELIKDVNNGESRIILISCLPKKDSKVLSVIDALRNDKQISKMIGIHFKIKTPGKNGLNQGKFKKSDLKIDRKKFKTVSMGFDKDGLIKFLSEIASIFESGFNVNFVNDIADFIDSMEVEEEKQLEFEVSFNSKKTLLILKIFLDDYDAPDVEFRSDPEIISLIEKKIKDDFEF